MVKFAKNHCRDGFRQYQGEKSFRLLNRYSFAKEWMNARMQEIADEAGINKALLHYYFHSKELLLRRSFTGF